jgi:DNA polymerase-1
MALNARKSDKIRGTYFENILKFSEFDGRIHPQINTMQARTGRMSVVRPALQTLPARGEGVTVRKAFLPSEGHVLYSADYSSIESRLAAHFGNDENMCEAFRIVDEEGGDFFVELGKGIWGPDFTKADPRRALAKTVMYAGLYGAGVEKMATSAGVSVEEMRRVSDDLFKKFPAIKACQKRFVAEAETNNRKGEFPFITTPYGRQLRVDSDKIYTSSNYAVQGHAAELLKQAIVNCDMAGLGEYLTLPVHDELIFDVPEDVDSREFLTQLRECMEVTTDMGYAVPLPVNPEGPMDRWGSK